MRRDGPLARALDAYQSYLAWLWHQGQPVAKVLFNEIGGLGYRGSVRSVARYVANWRTNEPPTPAYALLPGPRTLAWLLLRRPSDLDEADHALLDQLAQRDPDLMTTRHLVQQFMRMVRERRGRKLEAWVNEVQTNGPSRTSWFQPQPAPRLGRGSRWAHQILELRLSRVPRQQAE